MVRFLIIFISIIFLLEIQAQVYKLNSEQKEYYYVYHTKYESDSISNFIVYRGFVIKYLNEFRIPKFTYHKLTPEQISPTYGSKAKRRSSFFVDNIYTSYQSATNLDFKNSGYDRGHMVPAGDFYSDKSLKDETFVYFNVCPQNPVLNRTIWAFLENSIRDKILNFNKEAFIITGTIVDSINYYSIGPNKVVVPQYLYKIIFIPDLNVMYAFLFDNQIYEFLGSLEDYQVKVDFLEKLTCEDFFEKLPDEIENYLEATIIPFLGSN